MILGRACHTRNMRCKICNKEIAPEDAMYCPDCGADYCRDCAQGICDCAGELKRYS